MRSAIAVVLGLVGCGHGTSPATSGGGDAQLQFCTASAGTASVILNDGGVATSFTRLYAGAVWFTGA